MWSMKRILVPTDFSKSSELALEAAITLAKMFDAAIVLMHVYQVPVYPYRRFSSAGAIPSAVASALHPGCLSESSVRSGSNRFAGVADRAIWPRKIRAPREPTIRCTTSPMPTPQTHARK